MLTGMRLAPRRQLDRFHTKKDSCTQVKALLQREQDVHHVEMDLEKEISRSCFSKCSGFSDSLSAVALDNVSALFQGIPL